MATDYLLPISNPTIQAVTYSPSTSSVTGTLALTAAGNLISPTLSGTTAVNKLSCTFTLAPNSARTGVSATSTGISLVQGTNFGTVTHYGYVSQSTFVSSTSTITATIKFSHPNYLTTSLDLSAVANSARLLTTSRIDNPFFLTQPSTTGYSTFNGLTSINGELYRTVGRHIRNFRQND